jgi:hypothetical protein
LASGFIFVNQFGLVLRLASWMSWHHYPNSPPEISAGSRRCDYRFASCPPASTPSDLSDDGNEIAIQGTELSMSRFEHVPKYKLVFSRIPDLRCAVSLDIGR